MLTCAAGAQEQPAGEWLAIGGHADLDSVFTRPELEGAYSRSAISEASLAFAAAVGDWAAIETGFLYEHTDLGERQHIHGSEATYLEYATLAIGPPDGPWSVTAGRQFLPFGVFDTRMISEPLTLELGETNEIALALGWTAGRLQASVFGFDGDDGLQSAGGAAGYGAALAYSAVRASSGVALNLSFTSDIGFADGILGLLSDTAGGESSVSRVAAWSAQASLRFGAMTLIGEYLGALESYSGGELEFSGRGAKPSGWLLEAAYDFDVAGRNVTVAGGWQATRELLALELPARRLLASVSLELFEPLTLGVEWGRDRDYSARQGGSGEDTTTVTVQFSYQF